eukprot:62977_1
MKSFHEHEESEMVKKHEIDLKAALEKNKVDIMDDEENMAAARRNRRFTAPDLSALSAMTLEGLRQKLTMRQAKDQIFDKRDLMEEIRNENDDLEEQIDKELRTQMTRRASLLQKMAKVKRGDVPEEKIINPAPVKVPDPGKHLSMRSRIRMLHKESEPSSAPGSARTGILKEAIQKPSTPPAKRSALSDAEKWMAMLSGGKK